MREAAIEFNCDLVKHDLTSSVETATGDTVKINILRDNIVVP